MDTYSIQRRILKSALSANARLVGLVLAFHHNRVAGSTRIQRETVAAESGLSLASVRRAIAELVAEGIYRTKRTGRATIYVPLPGSEGPGKRCGIVDGICVTHQKGHSDPSGTIKSPFSRDVGLSTRCEENYKRPMVQEG